MSPGESTRICPVCRTPNLPTNPICTRCNHQFFASRGSGLRALDESALPQAPLPRGSPEVEAFSADEFEEAPLPPPPVARRPTRAEMTQAPPSPTRTGRAVPPRGKPKSRAKFPRVPKDLAENELEPLRYDAMRKSFMGIVVLIAVSVALPFVLGMLGVRSLPIGVGGLAGYAVLLVFFSYARAVGRASKKPISGVEQAALGRVRTGGAFLMAIPFLGSVAGQAGIYFQTSPMHPIYYAIAAGGIFYTLSGVTSLKERYSYYAVFEFGWIILLLQPLPALLPGDLGAKVFVNVYWFQTTFLFLAIGFFGIAFALRKMRAGQYDALEQEARAGQKALADRQYDVAIPHFDRAVTIAHSLFSDKLFKSTKTGQRALPADYYLPWVGKATALALSGRGAKALTILDIILEVDGTNAELWKNKGEVLLSLRRPAEAYIAFETAQRLNAGLAGVNENKQRALDFLRRRLE